MKLIKELWLYREMTKNLVKRDLKSRYKGSILGFLWMLINPLFQLVIYTIVFGYILPSDIDKFYMFLFVALVPWIFFSECLNGGTTCVKSQQDLVKKIHFPRQVLPISFVASRFVNMLLSFVVIFIVIIFSGIGVNPLALLLLPVIMLLEFMMALGITFLASALTVYFRDMEHIFSVLTLAWMYMTPVLYSPERIPEELQFILYANPMSQIIIMYRDVLYYKKFPTGESMLYATIFAVVLLLIGSIVFERLQRHFAEEL